MFQSITVCDDSISMSSNVIAPLEGVTTCVDEALVVCGGAKRGERRRILISVLRVVME
jgi:hypothetical protein